MKFKLIVTSILLFLIISCAQNNKIDLINKQPNLTHLSSDNDRDLFDLRYNTIRNSSNNNDSSFDSDTYERKKSRTRNSSSTRQRQFISDNGQTLRDKLEDKKQ